jgi:hypothetical protein
VELTREARRPASAGFALPTYWHGTTFRSRLEARWAIFFDALGLRWQYEPEGYALPAGNYLPDFFLPEIDAWIEVKPEGWNEQAEKLAMQLSDATGFPAFVAYGFPDPSRVGLGGPEGDEYSNGSFIAVGPEFWDMHYAFTVCGRCGEPGIAFEARGDRVARTHGHAVSGHGDRGHNGNVPKLVAAYRAGWSARFENGR